MPFKTFPPVVSFDQKVPKAETTLAPGSDDVDYAKNIAEAVNVQEIDTNLYMSKELWLPPGARGVFGGQVKLFYSNAMETMDSCDRCIDCCSSFTCCL